MSVFKLFATSALIAVGNHIDNANMEAKDRRDTEEHQRLVAVLLLRKEEARAKLQANHDRSAYSSKFGFQNASYDMASQKINDFMTSKSCFDFESADSFLKSI